MSDPSKTKCVGAKGVASTRTTFGCGRENTSVLMSYSAAGEVGPPLIIFKGKHLWDKWIGKKSLFPNTTFAASNNGWMDKEIFINYFQKSSIETTNPSPENLVLVIYDSHLSRIDITLIEIAR